MGEEVRVRERSAFTSPSDPDGRWEVVERVCNSNHLKRSAKLRDLLIYLCQRVWTDGVAEIREHDIGVEVFQRPPNYDSTQDTLVRVQASQLRKRLERYFAEEGREEPLILEIGKGTYLPSIRERFAPVPPAPAVPAGPADEHPLPVPAESPRWAVRLLTVACLLLLCLCIWLAVRRPPAAVEGPGLRQFWSAFAPEGEETTVVLADAAVSAIQDMLRRPIQLDEYVTRGYRAELERPEHSQEMKKLLQYMMEHRYTSLADAMLLKRLWTTGVLDPTHTSIAYARDLHLRSFQKGNHILVGSRRAVPWVDLFDDSLDFHFDYDEKTREVRVVNRHPRPGEPAAFTLPYSGHETGVRFSLVASLPNLSKTGNVLILSGQEMSGTEAGANLITTERLLQDLLARLPRTTSGMPHFEVVLRVKHVEYTMKGYDILSVHPH